MSPLGETVITEAAARRRPRAVVHADLDGAAHVFRHHGWEYRSDRDVVFETGMVNLLGFLKDNELRATLFVIAEDLDDPVKRELIEGAVAAGHEVASHGLTHVDLDTLPSDRSRFEIVESKRRLEDTLGASVQGFRAPNYTIDRERLEQLAEAGYRYDSSAFPDGRFARRLEVPAILPVPSRPLLDRPLIELPLPAHFPLPFPFHPSYSLLLGRPWFAWSLRRHAKTSAPLVLLFHLIDFAEPLPARLLTGLRSRVFTLSHLSSASKRARCQRMLDQVRRTHTLGDTTSLLEEAESSFEPHVVLGISTTHETGASLFRGRECLAAISEERLDRVKFSTRYPPTRSIDAALEISGIDPREITDVVIAGLPPSRLLGRLLSGQIRDTFEFHGWNDYLPHLNKVLYRAFAFARALGYGRVLGHLLRAYGVRPRLHFAPHHLCHAAAAYRTSPFDDALVVTADGVGDGTCLTISAGQRGRLRLLHRIDYPHSLGQFYTAGTQVLGFRGNRHEGKITGLSAYGDSGSEVRRKLAGTIRSSGPNFRLDKRYYSEGIVRGFSLGKLQRGEDLFEALEYRNYKPPLARLVSGHDREDVAAAFQAILEDELIAIVRPFAERSGLRNLSLCGGVFANVKANATLFRRLGFDEVYIYPHMGDGGLGVGAALEFSQAEPASFEDVYLGPSFDEEDMASALDAANGAGLRRRREDRIEEVVAGLLADGEVVARFDGRMEFGPRALGNRSILCSASRRETNTTLNERLGRSEFMPFAPVARLERASQLFENVRGAEHACKFMTIVLDCTDWTKEHCPAVVHVDGTARPQLVDRSINPSLDRILEAYEEISGIPLLINTSFNIHEEPIVCDPADAVRAFLAARLDYLAMGPFLAWIEA